MIYGTRFVLGEDRADGEPLQVVEAPWLVEADVRDVSGVGGLGRSGVCGSGDR